MLWEKNGQEKRTCELQAGVANGGGTSSGLPAWFTNAEPLQECQEGQGGVCAPGSLPPGSCSCQEAYPTILSFLVPAATSFPPPQVWE